MSAELHIIAWHLDPPPVNGIYRRTGATYADWVEVTAYRMVELTLEEYGLTSERVDPPAAAVKFPQGWDRTVE